VETRDKEIERLNRLLDGGRPVDAVLREGKKDSSERVVAHLNVQVYNVMSLLCQEPLLSFLLCCLYLKVIQNYSILILILLKFCIYPNTCKHQT